MVRIPVDKNRLAAAGSAHFQAVRAYIKRKNRSYQRELFDAVTAVVPAGKSFDEMTAADDWSWLEHFLLADVDSLKKMTENEAALKFEQFSKLYKNRFSAGSGNYVDNETQYNAYTFIKNLGVTVCPYCDEEYLDVVSKEEGGEARTLEIDHFFPKGRYPALAMCFYNLIPCGQSCNGLKLEKALGMNPFEADIEERTTLYPDLPLGINMESVSVDDCTIRFHPQKGMKQNVNVLRLEERYVRHKAVAHDYLTKKQQFSDEKIAEMVRAGFFRSAEQAQQMLYGVSSPDQLLQKLKRDILGRQR